MPRRRPKGARDLLRIWLADHEVTQESLAKTLKHPSTGRPLKLTQSYISMLIRDTDHYPSNLVACAIKAETGIPTEAWL